MNVSVAGPLESVKENAEIDLEKLPKASFQKQPTIKTVGSVQRKESQTKIDGEEKSIF